MWHGAAWTFILWGALHALYQTFDLLKRRHFGEISLTTWYSKAITIAFVDLCIAFAWIFFRAHTFADLKRYLATMFAGNFKTTMMGLCAGQGPMTFAVCLIAIGLLAFSYLGPRDCAYQSLHKRFMFTMACVGAIVFLGMPSGGEFIYFQF